MGFLSVGKNRGKKNEVKIAVFSGASLWESTESRTWISSESGWRIGMSGQSGLVQSQIINSVLLFSFLLWMQNEALGDPWGSESRS